MAKRVALLLCGLMFVFSLSGCATWHKQRNDEMQGLKNQISLLESQVQSKDEEINSLKESLTKSLQEKTKTITIE